MECIVKTFDELTAREVYEILQVRTAVFVVEQTCPYQEVDGVDYDACHVFLRDDRHQMEKCRLQAGNRRQIQKYIKMVFSLIHIFLLHFTMYLHIMNLY